ncbi:DUF6112 family protein [Gryllotalpicola reticulitermitis]|uniref:DUF6112 family protein n=1 Tax=Gryllotalpicola reticulitermitis TaxID=1184153 RepID=A0ABV8Q9I8_9MICO
MPHLTVSSGVYPNVGAVSSTDLISAVGALLTIVLITAAAMIVISGAAWAICHSSGNHQGASRARTTLWVCLGAAAMAGGADAWVNFLISVGGTI